MLRADGKRHVRKLDQEISLHVSNGRLLVTGRCVPDTKKELERLCELHAAGTFMAHCGEWTGVKKNLFNLPNGKEDEYDTMSEAS